MKVSSHLTGRHCKKQEITRILLIVWEIVKIIGDTKCIALNICINRLILSLQMIIDMNIMKGLFMVAGTFLGVATAS